MTATQRAELAAAVLGVPLGPFGSCFGGWLHAVIGRIIDALFDFPVLSMAIAILNGTALSFLGLGAQPPTPSWGADLSAARRYIRDAPWLSIFPGLAIFFLVLALNLTGDGRRDLLDSRRQRR